MEWCHRLCLLCLGGMGVWTLISMFLFVRLEIRTAWSVLFRRKDSGCPKERKKKSTDQRYERETEEEQKTALLPQRDQRM